jgi:hypothetical protein
MDSPAVLAGRVVRLATMQPCLAVELKSSWTAARTIAWLAGRTPMLAAMGCR